MSACRPGAPPVPTTASGGGASAQVRPVTLAATGTRGESAPPRGASPFRFEEVAGRAGVDFVNVSGMTAEKHFPTANGAGVAVFDADGDGRMDLYFLNACRLPLGTEPGQPNRLFRNLGGDRFQDVTERSGLGFRGFCHGVVVGDIDNDGDPDVFLANYGPNALFLNEGDGTFRDISRAAGVDRPNWSTGGAFLDYDGDGDLDLYVANYGVWSYPVDARSCGDPAKSTRYYCSPRSIRTTRHTLYRNNGDLTFADVTDRAGLGRADGHGFAAVAVDVDLDGLTDLYVVNDMDPNFLFINRGDGTFEDCVATSGAAFDKDGQAQSSMGVDAEDVDGDGLPELFVTNNINEYNTLYKNLDGRAFADLTEYFGLAAESKPLVGWGCALADFDNDGWPDCFVTNGHLDDGRDDAPYAMPPLLYRNLGGKRFRLASASGAYFAGRHVGRGAAFGDLDDDGRLDIVVNHKDGPAAVLLNRTEDSNRWVRLNLVGRRSNRDAVGARVEVEAGGRRIVRQRKSGNSVESSHDPRLLIGVAAATEASRVTVRWPSGAVSVHEHLATGRTHEIVEPTADR